MADITTETLKQFVDRIERLNTEKAELSDDIKEVYGEAKSAGYDVKILRKVIAIRKLAEHERKEQEEIIALYESALGMS